MTKHKASKVISYLNVMHRIVFFFSKLAMLYTTYLFGSLSFFHFFSLAKNYAEIENNSIINLLRNGLDLTGDKSKLLINHDFFDNKVLIFS